MRRFNKSSATMACPKSKQEQLSHLLLFGTCCYWRIEQAKETFSACRHPRTRTSTFPNSILGLVSNSDRCRICRRYRNRTCGLKFRNLLLYPTELIAYNNRRRIIRSPAGCVKQSRLLIKIEWLHDATTQSKLFSGWLAVG